MLFHPWAGGSLAIAAVLALADVAAAQPVPGHPATTAPDRATFTPYDRPTADYIAASCVVGLARFPDDTHLQSIRACGTKVAFSITLVKQSVPNSWPGWSCPPRSESCTPDVLWSDHRSAATVDFGTTVSTGGFEYEPNRSAHESVTVRFYAGPFGTGTLVGSITRRLNSSDDARLFGATSSKGFRSAVVTNEKDKDFAIAQIRV